MEGIRPVCIGGRLVGPGFPPLLVAEMSGNHRGSLQTALELVDAAAAAGAHAFKLQTYTPDSITLDHDGDDFRVDDARSPWAGRRLYDLYQEAQTPRSWHQSIFQRCHERGMLAFSAPFDEDAVDFLETLQVPAYKIASFEIVDIPLIRCVAATGKPLILSTGMASLAEIEEAVVSFREAGGEELILLCCTSAYPSSPADADLQRIPDLARRFHCPAGLSDHSQGIGVALAAISLGACLVEKHFVIRRADGGVDAEFSMEAEEFAIFVEEANRAWQAPGVVRYGPRPDEAQSLRHRPSLYVVADMDEGELFTEENLRSIRPARGLHPRHLPQIMGRRAKIVIPRGTPLDWSMIAD